MTRDPRIDPRPGDVLRYLWGTEAWTDHAVFNRCGLKGRVVEAWLTDSNMKSRIYRCFDLSDWGCLIKTAIIIKLGDAE